MPLSKINHLAKEGVIVVMSFAAAYPYIKVGLKITNCVSKSIASADEGAVELSFWDYLKIIGQCTLMYSGEIPDADKLQVLKKRDDFSV